VISVSSDDDKGSGDAWCQRRGTSQWRLRH